jgi:hypothetical protein
MVPDKFIKDKFPAYYNSLTCECPHIDALEQDVAALRFCEGDSVTPDDFRSYYQLGKDSDANKPGHYSVSMAPTIEAAHKLQKKFPPFIDKKLAKGQIKGHYGPSLLNKRKDHIDWWLYENSEPWHDFTMIDGQ